MISENTVTKVLSAVKIEEVVADAGVTFTAKHTCCCPFHTEKTPSFRVDTVKNLWYCFGCHEGGNAVQFLQKKYGYTFPDSIRWLADKYHITVEEEQLDEQERDKRDQEQHEKEAIRGVYKVAQQYFVEAYAQTPHAQTYAEGRWSRAFIAESGIGFAPDNWDGLIEYARAQGYSTQMLAKAGLVSYSEKSKKHFDFYRNRITIPIRNKYNEIIGYTARLIAGDGPKYINTPDTLLYKKDQCVFGIHLAPAMAVKTDKFYLVEGAPDVLRLQQIGATNAVASLGSAWTENQLRLLKRHCKNLCFLPDADPPKDNAPYGTGIAAVITNGTMALKMGFSVTVKEIPLKTAKATKENPAPALQKQDPDSFCSSMAILDDLEEQDFIPWFASKMSLKCNSMEVVTQTTKLLAYIDNEVSIELMLTKLTKVVKGKATWTKALAAATKNKQQKQLTKNSQNQADLLAKLDKYGFQEQDCSYYSIGTNGKILQWSNFRLTPLFHIKDPQTPVRLFRIENIYHQKEVVEFRQEDLSSLAKFRQKVEGLGNFVWLVKEEQLTRLKLYLYETTDTAVQVKQMGWQPKEEVYAFGNGIFDVDWHEADDLGIVRLPDKGNFYLPSVSSVYQGDSTFFEYERKFAHKGLSTISLKSYTGLLISVFGDNAKVAIGFLLAALFRDVVVHTTETFPILNIFGPKGTGKSELGHALMAFFVMGLKPENLRNTTKAALARVVARCYNACVHLDEFKNDLKPEIIESLKGIWDGTGRSVTDKESDKTKMSKVDTAVILTGQEMATVDVALLSRFIFLQFNRTVFTAQERNDFNQLKETRLRGCSHLTLELLQYRSKFEMGFRLSYEVALEDIQAGIKAADAPEPDKNIEDRIMKNWAVPIAAFRTLRSTLDIPMTYDDLVQVCIRGMMFQNKQCHEKNEVAIFWDSVAFLLRQGEIHAEGDFRITTETSLRINGELIPFSTGTRVIYLRYKGIFKLYQMYAKRAGEKVLDASSLNYYLEHSPGYLGKKKSWRFTVFVDGMPKQVAKPNGQYKVEEMIDQAYCFRYDTIRDTFDIELLTVQDEDTDPQLENAPKPPTEIRIPYND